MENISLHFIAPLPEQTDQRMCPNRNPRLKFRIIDGYLIVARVHFGEWGWISECWAYSVCAEQELRSEEEKELQRWTHFVHRPSAALMMMVVNVVGWMVVVTPIPDKSIGAFGWLNWRWPSFRDFITTKFLFLICLLCNTWMHSDHPMGIQI